MWRQYWIARAAEVRRGLAPLRAQAVDRRGDDQDHQRYLEVEIDDGDAGEREEREPVLVQVEAEVVVEKVRDDAEVAERGDEGEGERYAREVGGNARERRQRMSDEPRSAGANGRVGHEDAEQAADRRGDETDLDARPEGVDVLRRVDDLRDVLGREVALLVLEGARQNDG